MNSFGIPVRFDPAQSTLCDSRGIWPLKRIVYGPALRELPAREQQAVILHEAAHCKMFHVEHRLAALWRLFVRPASLAELCRLQEFEADRFVIAHGYGPDLARVLLRFQSGKRGPLHPSTSERIRRLLDPYA